MWARRATNPIPQMRSREVYSELNDYSQGMDTFVSNDKFPVKDGGSNKWRFAQNARILTLGEYETRKGVDFYSDTAGMTKDQEEVSTSGAGDAQFSDTLRLAQSFTTAAGGVLDKVLVRIKNPNGASGTVIVEVWTDDSDKPGVKLDKSSISGGEITGTYQYITVRFPNAQILNTATKYWIVAYVQPVTSEEYEWSSTDNTANSLVSTDSGTSWTAENFSLNFQQFYATPGEVKGLHRAYKSDGTKTTLFVQGTTLYSVNDNTGALTVIKSDLNASATHYRFWTINDVVYYVNGFDGYRKWDFTTESQVNSNNYTHIVGHKGIIFLVEASDPNKVVYSNFADYETFTSTDLFYVPSPKTGDPVTAITPLNGYLMLFTRNSKYILTGDDNATFFLEEAPDKNGTYSQETIAVHDNFVYYLSQDGMYRSNGSEPSLMSKNNYEDILTLANKESSCVAINRGRLYLWHQLPGISFNSVCWVWNINYASDNGAVVESYDTVACIQRAVTAFNDNDRLLVGCSIMGRVYWQEDDSNDYTNGGGDINFLLQTHYFTFGTPANRKEIRQWLPRFATQSGSYDVSQEYATDLRDNWQQYRASNVQGAGVRYGTGETYGSGVTYGRTAELQESLYVPGEFRRIALRYKHFATRQPQRFLGHTLRVQTRRIK
jgi:hypothetical protein